MRRVGPPSQIALVAIVVTTFGGIGALFWLIARHEVRNQRHADLVDVHKAAVVVLLDHSTRQLEPAQPGPPGTLERARTRVG